MCPGSAGSEGDFEALALLWESPNSWVFPVGQRVQGELQGQGKAPLGSAALDSEGQCSSGGAWNARDVLEGSSTLQSSTAFSLFVFISGFRGCVCPKPSQSGEPWALCKCALLLQILPFP